MTVAWTSTDPKLQKLEPRMSAPRIEVLTYATRGPKHFEKRNLTRRGSRPRGSGSPYFSLRVNSFDQKRFFCEQRELDSRASGVIEYRNEAALSNIEMKRLWNKSKSRKRNISSEGYFPRPIIPDKIPGRVIELFRDAKSRGTFRVEEASKSHCRIWKDVSCGRFEALRSIFAWVFQFTCVFALSRPCVHTWRRTHRRPVGHPSASAFGWMATNLEESVWNATP